MGLQVKRRSGVSARTTATLMTIMSVFAFVLSPFYGVVASQVASAAPGDTVGLYYSFKNNDFRQGAGYGDWSFDGVDRYSTPEDGQSLRFNEPGKSTGTATLQLPQVFSSQKIKDVRMNRTAKPGSNGLAGEFWLSQSSDGSSYSNVHGNITGNQNYHQAASIGDSSVGFTPADSNLSPDSKSLRLTWSKTAGDVAVSFVRVEVEDTSSIPDISIVKADAYFRTYASTNSGRIYVDPTLKNYQHLDELKIQLLRADGSVMAENQAKPSLINAIKSESGATVTRSGSFEIPVNSRTSGSWQYDGHQFAKSDRPTQARVIVKDSYGNGPSPLTVNLPNLVHSGITYEDLLPADAVTNTSTNETFDTIQEAVDSSNTQDGHTLKVNAAVHEEKPTIKITKDLTIEGNGMDATVLRASGSTTAVVDESSRAWFSVESGNSLTIRNLTLDANAPLYKVHSAVAYRGNSSGLVDSVRIKNVHYSKYVGLGVDTRDINGKVDIKNSEFKNINRIGAFYRGANVTGDFVNNVYTGKGNGDYIDYAADISAGAKITVKGNTVTNNKGVASSDGSTSAAFLVSTFWAPGTEANFVNNNLTGNSAGIGIGYDGSDTSVVAARHNNFDGNDSYGVFTRSDNAIVDVKENWWGEALASEVTGSVNDKITDYKPWLCQPFEQSTVTSYKDNCHTPQVESITANGTTITSTDRQHPFINGKKQRVDINVANPGAMKGGYLQLNKLPEDGSNPSNGTRVNFPIKKDANGWYAEVDTSDAKLSGDGKYLFKVEAHGATTPWGYFGNTSAWFSHSYYMNVDNTAPRIEVNGSTNLPDYFKISSAFKVRVFDDNLDRTEIERTDDNKRDSDHWKYTGRSFGLGWLKDGSYRMVAYDKTDNSTEYEFVVDKTRPTVSGSDESIFNPESFTITAKDESPKNQHASGIAKVVGNVYNADTGDMIHRGGNSTTLSNTLKVELGDLADGNYYVKYNAHDRAGNVSNTESFYFIVDNTKPTHTIESHSKGDHVRDTFTLSGTADDNLSGVESVTVQVNKITALGGTHESGQIARKPATYQNGNWEFEVDTSGFEDGVYRFNVNSVDKAGNERFAPNIDLVVDNTVPNVEIESVDVDGSDVTITGTTGDSADVEVTVDGEAKTVTPTDNGDGTYSWTVQFAGLGVGSHVATAVSTDSAGNVSDEATKEFSVAKAPNPSVTPVNPLATTGSGDSQESGLGLADAVSGLGATLTPPAPVFDTDSDVLGDETDADDAEGEVKASEDREAAGVSGGATKNSCFKLFGLCWYYWIPIVIVVVAIVWWLSSRKRDNEALV